MGNSALKIALERCNGCTWKELNNLGFYNKEISKALSTEGLLNTINILYAEKCMLESKSKEHRNAFLISFLLAIVFASGFFYLLFN